MNKLVLLLLPLMAMTTFAQSTPPDPFLIGVHGFAPEFDPVHHVCHYVRGVIGNPATLDERQLFLSATHFQLARDLGANLISTTIHPDFVFTQTTDNVVHQICDAASPQSGRPSTSPSATMTMRRPPSCSTRCACRRRAPSRCSIPVTASSIPARIRIHPRNSSPG